MGANVRMRELRVGQSGRITHIGGDSDLRESLYELGFFADRELTVLSRMPFGGPDIVEIDGACIALRSTEAECIQVRIV